MAGQIRTTNPATGNLVGTYDEHSDEHVEEVLESAADAFESWRERPVHERECRVAAAAEVLRENVEEYAQLMTAEMGKPVKAARSEVEKCAWVCEYYAERAGEYLDSERVGTEPGVESEVRYDPLGPVFAVMPWNFPFWQVFRFAAPALTAGNVGILKHAPNVPGCAEAIEGVFRRAGYPEGVFQALLVGEERTPGVADRVVADDRVAAATLTGSGRAGRAVAETAGANLKKTVLELGGSDPMVVLGDADLEAAAETGAQARNINSGQSCIAAKRFVVVDSVYEAFVDRLVAEVASLTVGDPTDPDTDVGPQAREDLLENLERQVEESVAAGATVAAGGERLDRPGHFYEPTVLTDVPRACPAAEEEVFGPVAAVFEVPDERSAIDLANDTDYGLGASVWTDPDRGADLAGEFDAGCVFVNELVKSDPRLPFGGVKDSGYGRELGREGIREFVNRKTVWVQHVDNEGGWVE